MSNIQIVKKVSLEFLGDRYEKSFINIRSISMNEREEIIKQLDKIKTEQKSTDFVKDTILDRFVDGEFVDGEKPAVSLLKEDLMDFPAEVFLEAMQQLQGRTSPKV